MSKQDTTTYMVLEHYTAGEREDDVVVEYDHWREIGEVTVPAGQTRRAIQAATEDRDDEAKRGTFVAISKRSWNPETRGVALRDTWQ